VKINNKLILLFMGVFSLIFVLYFTVGKGVKSIPKTSSLPIHYSEADWSYAYKDLNELTDKSDLVALIKVAGVNKEFPIEGIVHTSYNAKVVNGIVNCKDNQNIVFTMTGVNNANKHFEITDDPLPNKNDEFLIFARKNNLGTYTILGGPQGRLAYKDGKVSTLNHVTERVCAFNFEVKDKNWAVLKSKIKEHIINKSINIE
jgi:hypothetical protein